MQQETSPEMYLLIGAVSFLFLISIILFEIWYDKNVVKPVEEEQELDFHEEKISQ